MCGIFACYPNTRQWLEHSVLVHSSRGPDQNNISSFKNFGISINRLAITGDLEKGFQPVTSSTRNTLCVFNGAIFNTDELIANFSLNPVSKNDVAVVLELYEKIGERFLNYVRGMFALIVIDRKRDALLVSRDVLGIKPLYWVSEGDVIFFSSTIAAIPEKFHHLTKAFPPGTVWKDGKFIKPINIQVQKTKDIEAILLETIETHIPNEVKWGCSLSGGVDSALLAAMAKKKVTDVNCYTLETGEGEDSKAADFVAKFLKVKLKKVKINENDIMEAIPIVIKNLATYHPTTIIGALLTYFISKAAFQDGLKVMLFGEGADEMFGGYDKYQRNLKDSQIIEDVEKEMIFDQNNLWLSHNKRVEHASMAVSVEARVPFQDLKIVRNARLIPFRFKIDQKHRLKNKILLRAIASKYLPGIIFKREKATITQGTTLLQLVWNVVDRIYSKCSVNQKEVETFNLKTKEDRVFFSYWKDFYPNLANDETELIKRGLLFLPKTY